MAKNDSPHAIRMYNSIAEVNQEAADDLSERFTLSKSADFEKKFRWASNVCDFLEDRFDEDTICKIRSACNCEDGSTKADKMKHYLKLSKDLSCFVDIFNSHESYAKIELCGDSLLFIYPTCYCSYVKRVDHSISKTWCYCTLGYAKSLFEKVFEAPVKAELLESIKTGGKQCIIKITR